MFGSNRDGGGGGGGGGGGDGGDDNIDDIADRTDDTDLINTPSQIGTSSLPSYDNLPPIYYGRFF